MLEEVKALLLSLVFFQSSFAITFEYCGEPIPNIVSETNMHLIIRNYSNKPFEVVIPDVALSKKLIDQLNELDSDYLCLKGNLVLEEAVYFLEKAHNPTFYK